MNWVKSKEDFSKFLTHGVRIGHTHAQIMRSGCCDSFVNLESEAFKSIANDPIGYRVYGLRTGYPVYSNYNRHQYDPVVSDISDVDTNSLARGLVKFAKE